MPRRSNAATLETMGDLLEQLGGIAPHRIRLQPAPGKATEQDLIALHNRSDRLFELVDGVLVEKIVSYTESAVACVVIRHLGNFVEEHDLGIVAGPDGTMRLMSGLVRIPDVSFVSWKQLPAHEYPSDPIPGLAPELAAEVLSKGNTPGEMKRKLKEYFLTGVRLVWFVDPKKRTVEVFTAPDRSTLLTEAQSLDGGDVLPGLSLPLKTIFARVPRQPAKERKTKGTRGSTGKKEDNP